MRETINGTRYNTNDMVELASYDHRDYSNKYSGTTRLMEAGDGRLFVWTASNGHDCWLQDQLISWETYCESRFWPSDAIDDFDDIADEDRLVELGLIKVCPKAQRKGEADNG